MSLLRRRVLLLDCQTTGMRPSSGNLLEIAWAVTTADAVIAPAIESILVKQPEGGGVPRRISQITGISDQDLQKAIEPAEVLTKLKAVLANMGENPLAVIHYSSFEVPFLKHLFHPDGDGEQTLPFEILCSYKVAQKFFPQLPSRNIRGVAGFFGHRTGDFKRADCHVQATDVIWKGLAAEIEKRGMTSIEAFNEWLAAAPKTKRAKYEYHISAERRLKLPKKPGVYRMLAKTGEVLYVGKATSLRDRVNSYFRGQKGRDPRKLEMLAQTWDLDVTECETPLEAALLENDEIKRLNPPYNISLKVGRRRLLFYSRDFESVWDAQNETHCVGPLPMMSSLEQLRLLQLWLETGEMQPIFYEEIEEETLIAGLTIFLLDQGLNPDSFSGLRAMLALGMSMYRKKKKEEARLAAELTLSDDDLLLEGQDSEEEAHEDELEDDTPYTPEEVAAKFGRIFIRAAAELRRSKKLTQLLNARVRWKVREDLIRQLDFRNGRMVSAETPKHAQPTPWRGLQIADYDRMSILLSGISNREHSII